MLLVFLSDEELKTEIKEEAEPYPTASTSKRGGKDKVEGAT